MKKCLGKYKDYYSIVYQIDNICANMRRERKRG